ncbi:hypothetical protein HELRODRAFT_99280 [Helobdella robusta]|uniref:Uncharacterized protein n=1 Tax=Helobdella robusta TaxID=6412 RepID=T1G9R8_HELRO|nr:hypothetical protein HELRODRAFT_99280 [Helobdella robusta]ESO04935.1 hypothetical protein HELRODRAFT_99280 [Helobdella robusta]
MESTSSNNNVSQALVIIILSMTVVLILLVSYAKNILLFLGIIKQHGPQDDDKTEKDSSKSEIPDNKEATKSKDTNQLNKMATSKKDRTVSKSKFTHEHLVATLKSHTGIISDMHFSPNGKYLASCADDRSIYVWIIKDFLNNSSKSIRVNVDYDHATKLCFSPDNKAFLVTLFSEETIRVYKMAKKEDGTLGKIQSAFDFPEKCPHEVLTIGIASTGLYVMTCYKNPIIKIWDIKGTLLTSIDTLQMNHTHGRVSPCGRFVACSGFTSEVKVWEVTFSKTNEFKETTKAFQLGSHTSTIYSFDFNNDSTRMATISKDGTWKLWDTNIDYKRRQDPKLLRTWNCQSSFVGSSLLCLSANGLSVAIANHGSVYIYNVYDEDCDRIEDLCIGDIVAVEFSPSNAHLAVCTEKSIFVFHNVKGLKGFIKDLKLKIQSASTTSMKERIKEQINTAMTQLASLDK